METSDLFKISEPHRYIITADTKEINKSLRKKYAVQKYGIILDLISEFSYQTWTFLKVLEKKTSETGDNY